MSVYRIQYGGIVGKPINYSEFLCDSIEDINMLPTNSISTNIYNTCSIGSIAYVNGIKYILNNNSIWEINQQTKKALSNEITDPKTLNMLNLLNEFLHKTTTSIDDYENEHVPGYLYATCPIETINNSNIKTIDAGAFENCTSLTSVELSNLITLENGGFNSCTSLSTFIAPKLEYIGYYSLYNTAITELDLPNLKHIGEYGLCSLKELTDINIPNIEIIDEYAFSSCNKLISIDISNAKSIGNNAFRYCTNLTNVNLPNATSIGNYAFEYCTRLKSIELPNATNIGNNAFHNCRGLIDISLPSVTNINSLAFNYCTNLTNISLANAANIVVGAFTDCNNLIDIYLPNAQDTYTGAPWGAVNATIHYNCEFDENGVPLESIEEGE